MRSSGQTALTPMTFHVYNHNQAVCDAAQTKILNLAILLLTSCAIVQQYIIDI